jgi:dynein heavy chain 1
MIDVDIKTKMEECRAKGRDATEEDFDLRLKDNEFLKRLQKCVDHWYRDIRKVTQLKHDPTSGSALQEINFWLSLERSLNHIKEQLSKKEVQLTLNLLQQGQRMKTVFTFLHDTELEPTLKTAQNYNKILRDFPIN